MTKKRKQDTDQPGAGQDDWLERVRAAADERRLEAEREAAAAEEAARREQVTGRQMLLRVASFASVTVTVTAVLIVSLYLLAMPSMPESDRIWETGRLSNVTILDRYGDPIATRGPLVGGPVTLADLPPYVPLAFVAIEDRRFFDHGGIDMRGIARAMVANVRAGGFVQGGSTITQQLAKNLYLTPERTLTRKLQEMFISLWLEARLSKREILELYLNRVYLGAGTYGIEAASNYYFGKDAKELTLAEAALLAALPKAPTRYSPTNNLELAQARADLVLKKMVDAGQLTHGEVFAARANPASPIERAASEGHQYFVDWVMSELDGITGGNSINLVVKTTIDPLLQRAAEDAVEEVLARRGAELDVSQAGLIALDRTGAVRAMVGGRDYKRSQFNRAVKAKRQPGSAFKPFVYLTALEHGYTPGSVVEDTPLQIDEWAPKNVNDKYQGEVTLLQALRDSINTVAVQLGEEMGRDTVIETAHRVGIASPLKATASLPLGTSEVTLLELTSAYQAFGMEGQHFEPYGVQEIYNLHGDPVFKRVLPSRADQFRSAGKGAGKGVTPVEVRPLAEGGPNNGMGGPESATPIPASAEGDGYRKPLPKVEIIAGVPVIAEHHAIDMTHMLFQVINSGTGKAATLGERPAAGKTGTSQDYRDAWFVGYTADYTAGVWVGNDDGTPMDHVGGGTLPAEIWREFMLTAHANVAMAELPGAYEAVERRNDGEMASFLGRLSDLFGGARPVQPASDSRRLKRFLNPTGHR